MVAAKKSNGPDIRRMVRGRCLLILPVILLLFATSCESKGEHQPQTALPKLTVAVYPTTYTRLIAIADARGFFKDCGVEVEIKKSPTGTSALNAVCKGEAQIGTVVDFAFSWRMLHDPSVRVVASTGEVFESRIVARLDRGIRQPSDLKGRRIGYVPDTISEYSLHCFLVANNISPSDVVAVPVPLLKQADAVVNGEVDAVSAFATYASDAIQGLGENGVAWDSQNHIAFNALLAVKEGMNTPREAIARFLKALIMAESFLGSREEEGKSILMRDWGFSPEVIREYWDKTRVKVSLNQSIVTCLQIYSKWLMHRHHMEGDPPDVVNFIDTAPLDRVDPKRITVFR